MSDLDDQGDEDSDESEDDHELEDLEAKARTAGRGLWAMKAPVPPWEFRSNKKTKARQ